MRSHRRRGPLHHVLVAGDVTEHDSIEVVLALLPETAYGQVLIEAAEDAERPVLVAPARVTVTFLTRPTVGPGSTPGDRLASAVSAWAGEWLPGEEARDREVTLWLGATARGLVDLPDAPLQHL